VSDRPQTGGATRPISPEDARAAARLAEDARTRFEARYERRPSWDVDRPQPVFVDLYERGEIEAPVLDAGCGSGENALYLAAQGLAVWGLDIALPAIGLARAKARERRLPAARFLVGDALRLDELGMRFRTIIDSGLLHAMADAERALYVQSLERAIEPGGLFHVLCFSDAEPGTEGPRRIAAPELRDAFAQGWQVEGLVRTRFVTNIHADGAHAWSATIRRSG
jgi:SAM-dependent methyltransferase